MYSPDLLLGLAATLAAQVGAWSLGRNRILAQAGIARARLDSDTKIQLAALAHERDRLLLLARLRLPGCTTGSPLARPANGAA